MGKESKKQTKKGFPLLTTQQSNAYKEIVGKQGKVLLADTDTKIEKVMQKSPDPNYLSIFKNQYNPLKQVHQLDELQANEYKYDPKAKRDRHFNLKYQDNIRNTNKAPITSNQEYGWRQPIDLFPTNYGMKQTFDEQLMVTLKKNKQIKK